MLSHGVPQHFKAPRYLGPSIGGVIYALANGPLGRLRNLDDAFSCRYVFDTRRKSSFKASSP